MSFDESGRKQRPSLSLFTWPMLAAGIFLSACAAPQHFESDRPLKYINGFRVNPQNDVRYCTRMSEARGESKLRRLTETSQFEEIWIYIPKIKEWGEIGINEGNEIVDENDPRYKKKSVDLDGHYMNAVAKRFNEFTIYHIHDAKRRIESNVAFYQPQCSLPSYEDLCIDLKIATFYDDLNQGHTIRFKSISPFGVTEVSFAEYAKAHFQELLADKEMIKSDLAGFETYDFSKPNHFSTFKGSIGITYKPLNH